MCYLITVALIPLNFWLCLNWFSSHTWLPTPTTSLWFSQQSRFTLTCKSRHMCSHAHTHKYTHTHAKLKTVFTVSPWGRSRSSGPLTLERWQLRTCSIVSHWTKFSLSECGNIWVKVNINTGLETSLSQSGNQTGQTAPTGSGKPFCNCFGSQQ